MTADGQNIEVTKITKITKFFMVFVVFVTFVLKPWLVRLTPPLRIVGVDPERQLADQLVRE